jgi:hypothetical protein
MDNLFILTLESLNSLLTAGIAITAFSLLIYALSFNLRERVAITFTVIMFGVMVVFVGEAIGSVAKTTRQLEFWLHLQWVGIIILPAAYLHFSDAILATTGRPSTMQNAGGRFLLRSIYLFSIFFLLLLPTPLFFGSMILDAEPVPYLQKSTLSIIFSLIYIFTMILSWINFLHAYQRTVTRTSRRRISYLIAGALAPALGSYPYLLFGSGFANRHQLIFWITLTLGNLLVSILLVLMAYAVAFFGVSWPDRVVKRRLLKWIMRGPVTASTVLALTTLIRRIGNKINIDYSAIVPIAMVFSILMMEHLMTFIAPIWERILFHSKDRKEMELLQNLDERLLTSSDIQQFLESVLAAVCDRLQSSHAFIAILGPLGIEMMITIGGESPIKNGDLSINLVESVPHNSELFSWGDYWVIPISDEQIDESELLGILGVYHQPNQLIDEDQMSDLSILTERVSLAIRDWRIQQQAFNSLEELSPQMDQFQRLRAASRYDGTELLSESEVGFQKQDFSPWVKDALSHYWGGPKLTKSPLLNLEIVKKIVSENNESPINALRTILKNAMDQVRPEGDRRFTADWILYNILEMKFMEGYKVRDIAKRLAVSEADLYRKQRVAIEAIANAIIEMEKQARHENLDYN